MIKQLQLKECEKLLKKRKAVINSDLKINRKNENSVENPTQKNLEQNDPEENFQLPQIPQKKIYNFPTMDEKSRLKYTEIIRRFEIPAVKLNMFAHDM